MTFSQWIVEYVNKDKLARLDSLVWRGIWFLGAGNYEKAKAAFLMALPLRDELKSLGLLEYVLMSLAATWVGMGAYDEGVAFFSAYINSYPDDSMAYCGRAADFWYLGKPEEALRDYSRSIELDPNNALAISGQGQLLAEMGRNQEALAALDLAICQTEKANSIWHKYREVIEAFVRSGRGVAAAGTGQNELAVAEFDASMALSPDNAWVYYNRAQINERLGRRENALSDYKLALAKRRPPLTPSRREVAQARIRGLTCGG